ncbi:diaminopropionate ammonia-lyase [Lysinibacillus macroides]|uniref:Diaminopropionate ammonia-lyase n=1 Tax=Lysinibacillus macroides TaxID=33935 RepID=A0A0M9DLV4_9BACI|nr:diaminopropionate ammonia-lyase [Lysinibacillus macroides]KOY84068.1 diaminopropionate ammonia-lyase [Lysinibacillus macroides]QPR66837.1 diaminopropionate ammonia-lyase [Lysinibacillus macroides]
MKLITYTRKKNPSTNIDFLGLEGAQKVHAFHKSFPQYKPTPLAVLDHLAEELNISKLFVKDESYRFGLNAFKALGGSYAIGQYLAKQLNIVPSDLTYDRLVSPEVKEKLGELTFITATDGNHGRGVAWTAKQLGQKAVVYMPKGSSEERLNHIKSLGASASITDVNYDDTVRLAAEHAEQNNWILVQDTAWKDYEEIPKNIMQGYITMVVEAYEQLKGLDEKPTHIFIQAGVGSMAAAVQGFFADMYGEDRPMTIVVEPDKADCIFKTAEASDGKLHYVKGDMDTIMAGLACGEPSTLGWEILKDYADAFLSCPDNIAAQGMRILAAPLKGDVQVTSGESGAVGVGAVSEILRRDQYTALKEQLKMNEDSKILFFSTEGDTDAAHYKKIVWDGVYSI